jgi:hypothetical protein
MKTLGGMNLFGSGLSGLGKRRRAFEKKQAKNFKN